MYIAFLIVFAAAIAADLYDISKTRQGIKLGVGVEGNGMIVTLAGTDKPSYLQLLVINMLIPILPFGILGLIFGYDNGPGALMFTICLAFQVYGHYMAARQWVYLIKGGNPNTMSSSWFKKLFQLV